MAATFTRFYLSGEPINRAELIESIRAHAFTPIDPDGDDATSSGWCAFGGTSEPGVGDPDYTQHVAFGLRVDSLKIPPARFKHDVEVGKREFLHAKGVEPNRYQVAEIRETVTRRLRRVVPPTIAHTQVVLDTDAAVLWVFTANKKTLELVHELFERTANRRLVREAIYTRADRNGFGEFLFGLGLFDAVRLDADVQVDMRGADLLDRINACRASAAEFLLWLWWRSERDEGHFVVRDTPLEVSLDDRMVLTNSAVNAQTDTFTGGHPPTSAEAREALRTGKMPTQAKVNLVRDSQTWAFTIKAPDLALSGVKIPSVLSREDDDLLAERMILLTMLADFIDGLLAMFVVERTATGWPETHAAIREWAATDPVAPRPSEELTALLAGSGVTSVAVEVQALHRPSAGRPVGVRAYAPDEGA